VLTSELDEVSVELELDSSSVIGGVFTLKLSSKFV